MPLHEIFDARHDAATGVRLFTQLLREAPSLQGGENVNTIVAACTDSMILLLQEKHMATIRKTITLSDSQDAWIKAQIARGAFTNDSEYIRDLVRRDQEGQNKLSDLRQAIAEGLESGVSDLSLNDIWTKAEKRSRSADA